MVRTKHHVMQESIHREANHYVQHVLLIFYIQCLVLVVVVLLVLLVLTLILLKHHPVHSVNLGNIQQQGFNRYVVYVKLITSLILTEHHVINVMLMVH